MIDLGGGTGAVSIKLCEKYKNLESTIVDFKNVINTAKQHILPKYKKKEVLTRVNYMKCNVLNYDKWTSRFVNSNNSNNNNIDIALLSYLMISIPHTAFGLLFKNIRKVLKKKSVSQIIIHDFIRNDRKQSYLTSLWTLQHVTVNPGITMLTFDKISKLLIENGFTNVKMYSGLSRLTMIITANVNVEYDQQTNSNGIDTGIFNFFLFSNANF